MRKVNEKKLHKSVCKFKRWAKRNYPTKTEDNDNGEWELESNEFDKMYDNIIEIIKNTFSHSATEQMIDDILYGIARDNEASRIIDVLKNFPEWYSVLCRQCLKTNYTNAKWQFAESLINYNGNDNLKEMIYQFLEVDDEYTERLALMSLAHIYPDKAEKYAIDFWNRNKFENDEYQKIMVLHVLYKINSPELKYYLDLADQSEYIYLKENSIEIREKVRGKNGIISS